MNFKKLTAVLLTGVMLVSLNGCKLWNKDKKEADTTPKTETADTEKPEKSAKTVSGFDELIEKYSEDPGSKSKPGGYYFTAGEMVPEFENCTRELGMGEFGLCESTYGYHIIQRLPLEDSDDPDLYNTEFDAVKAKIRAALTQQSVKEKLPELLKENGLEVMENESGGDPIFKVGDEIVTKPEYDAYIALYTQSGYDEERAKEFAKTDILNNTSMIAVVNKQGGFSDEEKKKIADAKASVIEQQGGEEAYKEFLEQLGVDDSFIEKSISAQFAQAKLFNGDYSDDAVKEYFDKNYLRAKHILLMTQDSDTGEKYDDAKKAEIKKQAEYLLQQAKELK